MAIFHSYVTNYWRVTISTNVFGTALPSRRNLWSCLLPRKSHPKTKQQNVGKTCILYIGIFRQQKRHLTKELWIAGKLWFEQQHVGIYIYIYWGLESFLQLSRGQIHFLSKWGEPVGGVHTARQLQNKLGSSSQIWLNTKMTETTEYKQSFSTLITTCGFTQLKF